MIIDIVIILEPRFQLYLQKSVIKIDYNQFLCYYIAAIDEVSTNLFAVNDSLSLLKENGQKLSDALEDVRTTIDATKQLSSCIGCNNIDTSTLTMDADFDSVGGYFSHSVNHPPEFLLCLNIFFCNDLPFFFGIQVILFFFLDIDSA